MNKAFRFLCIIVLFAGILTGVIYASWFIYAHYFDDRTNVPQDTEEIAPEATHNTSTLSPIIVQEKPERHQDNIDEAVITYPEIDLDFAELYQTNNDFLAWLYIPCLDISNPVVRETYENEYEFKSFEGEDYIAGCLFSDLASSPTFTGYNDMIYGHNMKDGSMFGKLKQIERAGGKQLDEDPYIYLYTPTTVHKYRMFAYYVTTTYTEAYSIVHDYPAYDAFLNYIKEHTAYDIDPAIDFSAHPYIVTLSTCHGKPHGDERLVVHCVKIGTANIQNNE